MPASSVRTCGSRRGDPTDVHRNRAGRRPHCTAEPRGGDLRLVIEAEGLAARVDASRMAIGESIAVNGVCLTVVAFADRRFTADVSNETLRLTTLGDLAQATPVNLEAALRMGDPLGGHLMSGHVDGQARVLSTEGQGRSLRVRLEAPDALARYIAAKGSVALDGVSLTVNDVDGAQFGINLVPHTQTVTTLGDLAPGRLMNLEVDSLARYAERVLVHLRP